MGYWPLGSKRLLGLRIEGNSDILVIGFLAADELGSIASRGAQSVTCRDPASSDSRMQRLALA